MSMAAKKTVSHAERAGRRFMRKVTTELFRAHDVRFPAHATMEAIARVTHRHHEEIKILYDGHLITGESLSDDGHLISGDGMIDRALCRLGELAWAMGFELEFNFIDLGQPEKSAASRLIARLAAQGVCTCHSCTARANPDCQCGICRGIARNLACGHGFWPVSRMSK